MGVICIRWTTITTAVAFMFSKVFHDAWVSTEVPSRHFADFDSSAHATRGHHSEDQNMALTMRTFASAARTLSLQHRLHGKNFAVVTARGVHFSYVPDSPDPNHGQDVEFMWEVNSAKGRGYLQRGCANSGPWILIGTAALRIVVDGFLIRTAVKIVTHCAVLFFIGCCCS